MYSYRNLQFLLSPYVNGKPIVVINFLCKNSQHLKKSTSFSCILKLPMTELTEMLYIEQYWIWRSKHTWWSWGFREFWWDGYTPQDSFGKYFLFGWRLLWELKWIVYSHSFNFLPSLWDWNKYVSHFSSIFYLYLGISNTNLSCQII